MFDVVSSVGGPQTGTVMTLFTMVSAVRYVQCFSEDSRLVSEIRSPRTLRSASSTDVLVPAACRSSFGDRPFSVAGARASKICSCALTVSDTLSSAVQSCLSAVVTASHCISDDCDCVCVF